MKLRYKILLMCLTCTLIALILQTVLYQKTSAKLIYEQAKTESESSLKNMQNEIYIFMKQIERNMIKIYSEEDLINGLKEEGTATELRKMFNRKAFEVATSAFDTEEGVLAYYIYNQNSEIISTYRRATTPKHNYPVDIFEKDEGYNGEVIKQYLDSSETGMVISSYYNKYREKDIVRFVLKIYNNRNFNKLIGYVICDVDSKNFQTIMSNHITDEKEYIWLQPVGDRPFMVMGEKSDKKEETFKLLSEEIKAGNLSEIVRKTEKEEIFLAEQVKYNLVACSLTPQELLEQNQKNLTANLLLIAFVMVALSSVVSFAVSKSLTRPLDRLMNTMRKIKEGDTGLRAAAEGKDEIGQLGQTFNEMLDHTVELAEKENTANMLLAESRYKALQAQINPHFLYNTLDTMSSIAEVMECSEVSSMSQALSNIFRYSLNMKEPFSTVAKEIIHLKNYCYVMSVRMQGQLKFIYEIDENALQINIPRMSLQPLVENALNHGLRNKKGEKIIRIEAKLKEDELVICIRDNGVGFDAERMNETLRENSIDYVERGESIGIHNINARLKMLYGDHYGLRIESAEGRGTRVYMVLPHAENEEKVRREK